MVFNTASQESKNYISIIGQNDEREHNVRKLSSCRSPRSLRLKAKNQLKMAVEEAKITKWEEELCNNL